VVRDSLFLRSCVDYDKLPFRERYTNLWLKEIVTVFLLYIFMPDMAPILHALLWSPSHCHELLNMSRKFVLVSRNSYGGGLYVGLFVTNTSLKTTVFSDVMRKLIRKIPTFHGSSVVKMATVRSTKNHLYVSIRDMRPHSPEPAISEVSFSDFLWCK
jgi:hypothetical protein